MMAATWKVDATQILTRGEIVRILVDLNRRARRSPNARMNLVLFRLATCCGLRVSELVGLALGDVLVERDRPNIVVRREVAKGGKRRQVPLWWDAGTLADLTAWKIRRLTEGAIGGDAFLCVQSRGGVRGTFGRPLDRFNARKRFKSACRILGASRLRGLTIHHGRHSFVSHALAGGRSLAEVRDAAGHANIATTSIYAHVAIDDDGDVGDLFAFGK